jgi:hypothetical protein
MIDRIGNVITLLEYLVGRERELMQMVSRNGIREYSETFRSRGLTYPMIAQAIEGLNPSLVDQFKGEKIIGDVIVEARRRLAQLEVEANFSGFIEKFGGR